MLSTRRMTWQDVLNDPSLQDLPYKIELDSDGYILMSPATRLHALYQSLLNDLLRDHAEDGHRSVEGPVQTRRGVRVPDVAWMSAERYVTQTEDVFTVAPEICVEVVSPSNSAAQISEKIGLYLEAGALEVWTCTLQGEMRFFDAQGELERSGLVPGFPANITLK